MRAWIYHLLDWLTDRMVEVMIVIEPKKPRRQELDYTISRLPTEILAIIRISWYVNGKPNEIDEMVLLEDGASGYEAFHAVIGQALKKGASVSIRSGYDPQDLGIPV